MKQSLIFENKSGMILLISIGMEWKMREETFDVRLYVDVAPKFVDGIFDPERLPHMNQ
jgi:hypothetical protein